MGLKKKKVFDVVYTLTMLLLIICILFMPNTGKIAIVDVFIENIVFWGIFIYLILNIKNHNGDSRKKIYIYLVCLGVALFSLWNTKNLILDLVSGPQQIKLYDVSIESRQSYMGIIGLHYYLRGTDENGDRHIIEISGNDYGYMKKYREDKIDITYYKNIERLYDFGG